MVRGWLRRYHPEVAPGLHLLEGLVRSPFQLAALGDAAGGGALTQLVHHVLIGVLSG